MMNQAFICDAIRTPFGRYGGALSSVRADDLGAIPIKALMARNPNVDWQAVTDVSNHPPAKPGAFNFVSRSKRLNRVAHAAPTLCATSTVATYLHSPSCSSLSSSFS